MMLHVQQKFRRVRKMSDDEDDEEEDYGKEEHEKEAIAEEIFQDGEGEEGGEAAEAPLTGPEEEEEEEEDESGMTSFTLSVFTPCLWILGRWQGPWLSTQVFPCC